MKILTLPLILASKSPRRSTLLEQAGLKFKTDPVEVDESYPLNYQPEEVAMYLSSKKANAYNKPLEKHILICADTVVSINGQVLGKPDNKKEAYDMIKTLSGTTHEVITGVCLKDEETMTRFYDTTQVSFRKLQEEEIYYYIENLKPYDKAGAYGIQEWIGLIGIESIEGSYFNVMGLPVEKVYRQLRENYLWKY